MATKKHAIQVCSLLILSLMLAASSARAATPVPLTEDLAQFIADNPSENEFFLEAGTYTLTSTLLVDRDLRIAGAFQPGETGYDIIIEGTGADDVIDVVAGNTLLLENIHVRNGLTGIICSGDVDIWRCYFEALSTGLSVVAGGSCDIAQSSMYGMTAEAAQVAGGDFNMMQCTLRDNATGVNASAGNIYVGASYIVGGSASLVGSAAIYESFQNIVDPAVGAGVNETAAPDPTVPTFDASVAYKIRVTAGEERSTNALLAAFPASLQPLYGRDFENEQRQIGVFLIIGADGGVTGAAFSWYGCSITPAVDIGGEQLLQTDAGVIDIRLFVHSTTAIDMSTVKILLLPEGYPIASAYLPAMTIDGLDVNVFGDEWVASLFVPPTFINDGLGGPEVTSNGKAIVHIVNDTEILGEFGDMTKVDFPVGAPYNYAAKAIIDTVAPQFTLTNVTLNTAMVNWPPDLSFATLPEPTSFPGIWGPGVAGNVAPASQGTFANGYPMHMFFNGLGTDIFTVTMSFIDVGPAGYTIEPSGFASNVFTAVGDVTPLSPLEFGYAAWESGSGIDAKVGPTVTVEATHVATSNGSDTEKYLDSTFTFDSITAVDGNNINPRLSVSDVAGNIAVAPEPFQIWWMYRNPGLPYTSAAPLGCRAVLDSGPDGISTSNPVFTWKLERPYKDPAKPTTPCFPVASFRLSYWDGIGWVTDPTIAGWSFYTANRTIDRNTIAIANVTLGEILDGYVDGTQFMLEIKGADEAGNVQNDLEGNVHFRTWTSQSILGKGLDTQITASFAHRNLGGNAAYTDISFGAGPRIPLPPWNLVFLNTAGVDYRVEAQITFNAVVSEPLSAGPQINYEIYEDNVLVTNVLSIGSGGVLIIPDDLIPMGENGFLNLNLLGARDRLGDEGNPEANFRRREVKYTIVAKAVAVNANGVPIEDTTPAVTHFSVYVDQPVKDEQPIRESTRVDN